LTFERSAWRRNGVPISGENYNHDENRRLVKNNLMGILENKKFQNCVNSCKHGQDVTSTCVKSCVKLVPLHFKLFLYAGLYSKLNSIFWYSFQHYTPQKFRNFNNLFEEIVPIKMFLSICFFVEFVEKIEKFTRLQY
jgi:hypothetical protein